MAWTFCRNTRSRRRHPRPPRRPCRLRTWPTCRACRRRAVRKVLYWYDPMHPAYKSDKPGTAPDCGMTLVPKYADDENMAKMPMGTVTISAEKQVMAGVRTAIVDRKPLVRDIRTTAQIVADETKIAHVHVKVSGYVEKVYVDYVGDRK